MLKLMGNGLFSEMSDVASPKYAIKPAASDQILRALPVNQTLVAKILLIYLFTHRKIPIHRSGGSF
jgi:hypothetical protein